MQRGTRKPLTARVCTHEIPQWRNAKRSLCSKIPLPSKSGLSFHWQNRSFRSSLSESDPLFIEGLREITTCIYRAIITHHHLVHAEHRESHSVWTGAPYFKLMGAQRPDWGLFNGSQPWQHRRITWGAFKKNTSAESQPKPIKSELLGVRSGHWFLSFFLLKALRRITIHSPTSQRGKSKWLCFLKKSLLETKDLP